VPNSGSASQANLPHILGDRALIGNASVGANIVSAGAQIVAVSYRLAPAM